MTMKARETAKDVRRVQFDLLPHRLAAFDQLMEFCDLHTRKDLFNNAMTLFEWAVQEVRAGRKVASYDNGSDHVEIVRFPVLDNAARRAQELRTIKPVDTTPQNHDRQAESANEVVLPLTAAAAG